MPKNVIMQGLQSLHIKGDNEEKLYCDAVAIIKLTSEAKKHVIKKKGIFLLIIGTSVS